MRCLIRILCVTIFLAIAGGIAPSELDAETSLPSRSILRWKDIATNTYAQSYKETYDYGSAIIDVTYDSTCDSTLRGHLSAVNLKPNFAYQMKLTGKPTALWGTDGDDATNERLGYLGRWWRHQPDPGNSTDADYEANHDQPGYIFEGYLIFDFLITDSTGCVEKDIAIDSSYHVLWWAHQRTPAACDSPVLWSTVIGHASHPAYAQDVGPTSVGVYAEIERLCTGTTTMPPGFYDCCFVLTEESFHQSGVDEGQWYSLLVDDSMQFEISDLTAADSQEAHLLFLAEPACPNPFLGSTNLQYTIPRAEHVTIAVFDIRGRRIRRLVDEVLAPRRYVAAWNGSDDSGRPVASGTYFCRLTAGSHSETRRMVLIR
jgi:hypothetical protein